MKVLAEKTLLDSVVELAKSLVSVIKRAKAEGVSSEVVDDLRDALYCLERARESLEEEYAEVEGEEELY